METHFVVNECAYLIPEKCLVFVFDYMALVKYLPIFKMAAIVNLYPQMLIGDPVTGACCFDEAGPDHDLI